MPQINLLPWREDQRREKQRQFINIAAGTAILMVGVIVLVHLRMAGVIEEQNNRNQFLKDQIVQVDKDIKEIETLEKEKSALLARMKVIQELQGSRPEIVHIFDEIAKAIPDKVFLLNTTRKGREIDLIGVADSNDYVSELMRNLNNSPWLTNPRLTVIQSNKKEYPGASWFQMKVSQASPKTQKADK
ncbi:MAG: PilN domain-containing protein [Ectothiorhodospiraceae bacterium]|nr:PilN domain-containing protein [Ectothiorhodospiraceae bacterium]